MKYFLWYAPFLLFLFFAIRYISTSGRKNIEVAKDYSKDDDEREKEQDKSPFIK